MKNKDRDYAYLIGSKYQKDLTWEFFNNGNFNKNLI